MVLVIPIFFWIRGVTIQDQDWLSCSVVALLFYEVLWIFSCVRRVIKVFTTERYVLEIIGESILSMWQSSRGNIFAALRIEASFVSAGTLKFSMEAVDLLACAI